MTSPGAEQGSCGHVKCSRTFLIPTQAGRGTEVHFLPLLLYFCDVSTVFAEVPDPGTLITPDGQLVAGSAILCMSNVGPPHVLMTAATVEGIPTWPIHHCRTCLPS